MDEITRITKELIKIESSADKPEKLREIVEYVKKELKGFEFKEYESNGIPSILFYNDPKGLKDGFKIILNGHLDVVKGTPDQFNPVEKDGRIY
ncbi:MAG: M20 family peptidase, partial [bacterium]